MKKALVIILGFLALSGCASFTGSAFYTYTKVGTDCTVKIDSGRVLKAGATLKITDCNIEVSANSLEQGTSSVKDATALVNSIGGIILGKPTNGNDTATGH